MNQSDKHKDFSDAELVEKYRQSANQQWLAALYERYADLLFGVCLKYLKSPDAAADACLDIYEELVPKLLKHEVDYFRGWLHTLAKNHCLQKLRSSANKEFADLPETIMQLEEKEHLEEVWQKEVQLTRLEKCVETLGSEQKQAIELFYLQEKCYNEIVALTGLTWKQVRSQIQNGRRNLKNCMENSENG